MVRKLVVCAVLVAAGCPSSSGMPGDAGSAVDAAKAVADAPGTLADAPGGATGTAQELGALLDAAATDLARMLASALAAGTGGHAAARRGAAPASVPCPGGGSLALVSATTPGSPSQLSGTLILTACSVGGYTLDGTLDAVIDQHTATSFTLIASSGAGAITVTPPAGPTLTLLIESLSLRWDGTVGCASAVALAGGRTVTAASSDPRCALPSFGRAASMLSSGRYGPCAVAAGGLFVVAGGAAITTVASDAVDVYDGLAWTTYHMAAPRRSLACAAQGHLVYLMGGGGAQFSGGNAVEILDLAQQKLAPAGFGLNGGGYSPAAATCLDGTIVVAGGLLDQPTGGVTIISPQGQVTHSTLSVARFGAVGVSVTGPDQVIIAGGYEKDGSESSQVDVFDCAAHELIAPVKLPTGRGTLAAAAVGGRAFFAGRSVNDSRILVYDAVDGRVTALAQQIQLADVSAAAVGPYVFFAGGSVAFAQRDDVTIVDTSSCLPDDSPVECTLYSAKLGTSRSQMGGAGTGGLAIFAGGNVGVGNPGGTDAVDVFTP